MRIKVACLFKKTLSCIKTAYYQQLEWVCHLDDGPSLTEYIVKLRIFFVPLKEINVRQKISFPSAFTDAFASKLK
jgi:hypothetical protein